MILRDLGRKIAEFFSDKNLVSREIKIVMTIGRCLGNSGVKIFKNLGENRVMKNFF